MNRCMTLTCSICSEDTDCRIGFSNRDIQPLSFACPHCESVMYVTLTINTPDGGFTYQGCRLSENQPNRMFDGANPFIDLHLDFPVQRGSYAPGMTPFIMAMSSIGGDFEVTTEDTGSSSGSTSSNTGDGIDDGKNSEKSILAMQFHAQRLNALNHFSKRQDEIKSIIGLYKGKNKQLFKKKVSEFLNADFGPKMNPQDINFALYKFVHTIFDPFLLNQNVIETNEAITKLIIKLPKDALEIFAREIIDSQYLKTLQLDCLKLYPEMYAAEMPLRAALFLDITSQDSPLSAGRISTKDFNSYKDLYKDICEVIARQLILVAGINNIIKRGAHTEFPTINGGKLSSLSKLSEKTLSDRFKYLDDPWYAMDRDALNAGIRNAIAHNNISYENSTQEITYYPDGGTINKTKEEKIYFLNFMKLIISAFREAHDMHLIIKALLYVDHLVFNRNNSNNPAS